MLYELMSALKFALVYLLRKDDETMSRTIKKKPQTIGLLDQKSNTPKSIPEILHSKQCEKKTDDNCIMFEVSRVFECINDVKFSPFVFIQKIKKGDGNNNLLWTINSYQYHYCIKSIYHASKSFNIITS